MSEDVFEIIAAAVSLSNSVRDRRVKACWVKKGWGQQHCSPPSAVCSLPMVHMKYELRKLMTNISTFIA